MFALLRLFVDKIYTVQTEEQLLVGGGYKSSEFVELVGEEDGIDFAQDLGGGRERGAL